MSVRVGQRPSRRARRAARSHHRGRSRCCSTLFVASVAARRARRRTDGRAPKPGGEITYGLEAETGGGWCLPDARLAISGIMVGRRHLRHARSCRTQERDGAVPRRSRSSPTPTTPSGRSSSATASSSTTAPPLDADAWSRTTSTTWRKSSADRRRVHRTSPTSPRPTRYQVTVTTKPPWVDVRRGSSTSTAGSGSWRQAQLDEPGLPDATSSAPARSSSTTGPSTRSSWSTRTPTTGRRTPKGKQLPYLDKITFKPVAEAAPAGELAQERPVRRDPHLRRRSRSTQLRQLASQYNAHAGDARAAARSATTS